MQAIFFYGRRPCCLRRFSTRRRYSFMRSCRLEPRESVAGAGTFVRPLTSLPGLTCLKVSGMKMSIVATDQDLEFDDGLEDFDDPRYRPPRRRWFRFLLLILLIIGTWYIVTDPERRSFMIHMMPDTVLATLGIDTEEPTPERERDVPPTPSVPPVPAFHEGQQVTVAMKEGRQARFRLRNAAEGEQRGPVVKSGDVLTVMDGSLIQKKWIYFVQTSAEESGWIKEMHLQPQS